MLKEQAGKTVELPQLVDSKYLEHRYCEITREIHQSIHYASLEKFTQAWIESLVDGLNGILYQLNRSSEPVFKELIEVIQVLSEARNELRLARFLFDVEEINSVHRLMMRNRAVLRSERLLDKVLRAWPLQSSI